MLVTSMDSSWWCIVIGVGVVVVDRVHAEKQRRSAHA